MKPILSTGFAAVLVALGMALGTSSACLGRPLRVAINAGPEGDAIRDLQKQCSDPANPAELVPFAYSALREQLISALVRRQDRFDVVMIDDPWFPQLSPQLQVLKNVPPSLLDDIVDKSLALGKEPYSTGQLKALPYVGNTQLLFIRSDILSSLNIKDKPETWDAVAALAGQLVSPPANRYGYAIRGRAGAPVVTDFLPIYWSLGGKLTEVENGRRVSKLDADLFRNALKTYRGLEQSSPPGAINFDWSEMTAAFTNGQAVMELNWPAAIPQIEEALKGAGHGGDWVISLPPKGSNGGVGTSMIGNWLLGIPQGSQSSDAAAKFITCLLEHQEEVANEGRPPTRKSVFEKLAQSKPYFNEVWRALELSTARDRTDKWSRIEEAVSRAVTGYLVRPEDDGPILNTLKAELDRILR
jgi:multiple sugar transport system substrate-binding protein